MITSEQVRAARRLIHLQEDPASRVGDGRRWTRGLSALAVAVVAIALLIYLAWPWR
jgi:hypothetical protein